MFDWEAGGCCETRGMHVHISWESVMSADMALGAGQLRNCSGIQVLGTCYMDDGTEGLITLGDGSQCRQFDNICGL